MNQAITLKHISQISGYSISTVSKALNNRSDVSKQAKFKISKIAKSNNYIPNNTALALRSKKTKIIAVIIPHINSTLYGEVLSGIQVIAFNKGYKVLILQTFGYKKRESECINEVMDGSVDGIIIIKLYKKTNVSPSIINGTMFPSSLIYIDVKPSMSIYEIKALAEESLNRLLLQIN